MKKGRAKAGSVTAESMRALWEKKFAAYRALLPRQIYTDFRGAWRFDTPQTREQKLAAGWTPMPSEVYDFKKKKMVPGGEAWMVEAKLREPLLTAESELADVARDLADAAVKMRVAGSRELRQFERELRESRARPSRDPLLLLPDVELVITDVLHAMPADTKDAPEVLNPVTDLLCIVIRRALAAGAKMRKPIVSWIAANCREKDGVFPRSERSVTHRCGLMKADGQIKQHGDKGAYELLDRGRELHRHDEAQRRQ